MRFMKIAVSAILLAVMCLSMFACGVENIEITVRIAHDDFEEVKEGVIEVTAGKTTVLGAISEFCMHNNIKYEYNTTADSIKKIGTLKEVEKNKFSYFWSYTVNGKEVAGRASDNIVNEGDVITYTYTSMPLGDCATIEFIGEDGAVITGPVKVVFESGSTVIDIATAALKQKSIKFEASDDGKDVSLVKNLQAKVTPAYDETWEFTVDGEAVNTAAGDTTVIDGDKIVFTFVRTMKEVVEE